MLDYFHLKKGNKQSEDAERSESLVLREEDEAFLHRIALEGTPPPLPERPQTLPVVGDSKGNDAEIALLKEAQNTPLPDISDTPSDILTPAVDEEDGKGKGKESTKESRNPFSWSFLRRDSRDKKRKNKDSAVADPDEGIKRPDALSVEKDGVSTHEHAKEEEEMTEVLEQLSLAAVNNRVFSISKDSQELLRK